MVTGNCITSWYKGQVKIQDHRVNMFQFLKMKCQCCIYKDKSWFKKVKVVFSRS